MEIVEPPVEPIRYPEMRSEVVDAVKSLSDPDYQRCGFFTVSVIDDPPR
ncbi:hypothetical protein [Saccharopolyspora hattusasensis]